MELTLLLIIAALLVALLALTLTRNNRAQSEEMQRALRQQMQENREGRMETIIYDTGIIGKLKIKGNQREMPCIRT